MSQKIPDRKMMYGGGWHSALDGATFGSVNPANAEVVAQVPLGGAADARAAVDAAHAAFPAWSRRTAADRALLMHRVADRLEAKREEIAVTITMEEGKPLAESRNEMRLTIDSLHWYAEEARRAYGSWIPDPVPNRRLLSMRQPVGVCGAIIPWNVPAAMITRKAAPALAVGCTMVLKPATLTPLTALALAALAERAGIPAGVFNVITGGSREIGAEITSSPVVRKLSFTGSTEVGKTLMAQCAPTMKKLSMELGGNAPFIVFADADLDAAAEGAIQSKYRNSGQTCVCVNRILVQREVAPEFEAKLKAAVAGLRP